ncbi:MAG: hypothetical protein V2A64_01310 [Candidatus Omnitrophota bacterium]
MKNKLMPAVEKDYKNQIQIEYYDLSDIENYKLLYSLKERYQPDFKIVPPVFFTGGYFLNGDETGEKEIRGVIKKSLLSGNNERHVLPAIDLMGVFKNFEASAVISAGLIDGINPCAFTVIVFFISFLALQGYRKRDLIIIGLVFIFSVFLTYLFIGVGLFSFLYRLNSFWVVAKIFNLSIGVLSIVLGVFALADFLKFKRTKETEGLILQLPKPVKDRIHSLIGLHYRRTHDETQGKRSGANILRLILSAFITGFLVSLLEAVCTGQVYLPTITFVLKTAQFKLQALWYLLVYNLMFVVPLLIVFLFALLGTTSEQFARIFKKHLLTIKIFMAVLFFSLGVFLIWRA